MNEGNTNFTAPVQGTAPVKNSKLGLLLIPAIIVVLLIVGVVAKVITSSPKAVFKSTINGSYKEVSKYLKKADKLSDTFDIEKKALYLKGDLKLSTNVEQILESNPEIKDMKISYEGGVDLKHEELLAGATIDGDKESVGGTLYLTDGIAYMKTTFLDDVYKMDAEDLGDISNFFKEYDEVKDDIDVDPETYDYLIKTVKNALVKSLDSKSMEKSKGTFEVDGKKVNATKVTYVFTKSSTKELINKVVDILLEDDKFVGKLADVTGQEKADIKDVLKEVKTSAKEIDFDKEIRLNLYVKGLFNKVVGASLEYSDKEYVTIFKNGKITEAILDNHEKDDAKTKIVVTAVENKKETEVTVKVNKEKIATITIREFSEKVIDFDAVVERGDEKVKLTVYLSGEQKKSVISGEYKFKVTINDEYAEFSGNYSVEALDKLSGFKTDGAKSPEELDDEEVIEALKEKVEKDDKLNSFIGPMIEDLEEQNKPTYDYNDMIKIYYSEDFEKLFTNNKAKVLYIGSSYYSSYSEETKYNLFKALTDAQDDYNFHSYYYPDYYMESSDEKLLKDSYTCDDTYNCDKYPAIYFIKGGEVKKVLRGTVTEDDIKAGLQEIGLY